MKRISLTSVVILLLAILTIFALYFNGNKLSERIANLQGQNQKLKEQNELLNNKISELKLKIDSSNQKIKVLERQDTKLETDYHKTQTQITNLKPSYDKADNYSRNYNADSIRIYFSNL